jgi:hypothetical protein
VVRILYTGPTEYCCARCTKVTNLCNTCLTVYIVQLIMTNRQYTIAQTTNHSQHQATRMDHYRGLKLNTQLQWLLLCKLSFGSLSQPANLCTVFMHDHSDLAIRVRSGTGFCRIFATGTPQVVLIKLHYCGPGLLLLLPNKEQSTVLALHSSLQNPVPATSCSSALVLCHRWWPWLLCLCLQGYSEFQVACQRES